MKIKKIIKSGFNLLGLDIKKFIPENDSLGWLKDLNINTVIDIGANTGQFAKEIRQKLTEAKIYSFEPMKQCYSQLNENFKEDKNFKSFNFALGDVDKEIAMNVSPYTPSSSLLKMTNLHETIFPHTKGIANRETIAIKRLDDFFETLKCSENILFKLDVQGYEDKVILGATNSLSKGKAILIETSFFPLYEGQLLFGQIYELLKKLGFSYAGCNNRKKNPLNGRTLFEDSIFIR